MGPVTKTAIIMGAAAVGGLVALPALGLAVDASDGISAGEKIAAAAIINAPLAIAAYVVTRSLTTAAIIVAAGVALNNAPLPGGIVGQLVAHSAVVYFVVR